MDTILPEFLASLQHTPNLIIEAPPGAGKTTRVPAARLATPRTEFTAPVRRRTRTSRARINVRSVKKLFL